MKRTSKTRSRSPGHEGKPKGADQEPERSGDEEVPSSPGAVAPGVDGKLSPGAIAVVVAPGAATLAWCLGHDEISRLESHAGRMWLAGICIALALVTWRLSKTGGYGLGWPRRLFDATKIGSQANAAIGRFVVGLWFAATIFGVFNYYQFDRETFTTGGDYQDATYYYLNSKYFEELGYFRLYEAMLVADEEGLGRFARVERYRDLEHYRRLLPRSHALSRAEEVKSHFSTARWEAFRHDLTWFTSQRPRDSWNYVFNDHGYNPPPTWTFIGGTLCRLTPVEYVDAILSVDVVLVVLMIVAVGWAFGLPTALLAALFFVSTLSGRWPILGQSILRFDWQAAVVIAICALKKSRHGVAGGLLTYAALIRIFPGAFGVPYAIWMAFEAWRARRAERPLLSSDHKRFLVGAAATVAIVVGGAYATLGHQAFVDSVEKMKHHAGSDSFSSQRVGLGSALIYRFETTRREIAAAGGLDRKGDQLGELGTLLKGLGILSLLLMALYIWKARRPPWQLIWLGFYPIFIMTTPTFAYFNFRVLLIPLHLELLPENRDHMVAVVLLFLVEILGHYLMTAEYARYTVMSATSLGLCVYLGWMILLMARELARAARPGKR